jgi:hypothetical protein
LQDALQLLPSAALYGVWLAKWCSLVQRLGDTRVCLTERFCVAEEPGFKFFDRDAVQQVKGSTFGLGVELPAVREILQLVFQLDAVVAVAVNKHDYAPVVRNPRSVTSEAVRQIRNQVLFPTKRVYPKRMILPKKRRKDIGQSGFRAEFFHKYFEMHGLSGE